MYLISSLSLSLSLSLVVTLRCLVCSYAIMLLCRPNTIEDYIHRIGRTGRAGAKGVAVSFFTEKQSKLARELVDILREAKQVIPPELQAMVSHGHGGGGGGHYGGGRGGGGGGGGGRFGGGRY